MVSSTTISTPFSLTFSAVVTRLALRRSAGRAAVFIRSVRRWVFVGIDPVWNRAKNELQFLNSYKMKISVIFGVTQMVVGIFLKAVNSAIFRKPLDFFFEFLP